MTIVKICGITNIDDARHATVCGTDALGFNFYKKSPRYIDPSTARSIVDQIDGSVDRVGVFVNEQLESIERIALSAGLSYLQLHGSESPAFVQECSERTGLPVIKAFSVGPGFVAELVTEYKVDSILLDAYSDQEAGGTGKICDWMTAVGVRSVVSKLFLAGGLSPENVVEAIRTVRPFAVDACSRLESTPGRKDRDKVERFITAAKQAI
jgi:phosphoribosylanthranilate isomerase